MRQQLIRKESSLHVEHFGRAGEGYKLNRETPRLGARVLEQRSRFTVFTADVRVQHLDIGTNRYLNTADVVAIIGTRLMNLMNGRQSEQQDSLLSHQG